MRAGLMTPVVIFGGLLSGIDVSHVATFGAAFGGGMLLHAFARDWFGWLHFSPQAGSPGGHLVFALARGAAVMALCYTGCAIAGAVAAAVHVPILALWLQALWAGVLIDSMLVVGDDDGSRKRRRTSISDKVQALVDSVTRVHAPAPVPL